MNIKTRIVRATILTAVIFAIVAANIANAQVSIRREFVFVPAVFVSEGWKTNPLPPRPPAP